MAKFGQSVPLLHLTILEDRRERDVLENIFSIPQLIMCICGTVAKDSTVTRFLYPMTNYCHGTTIKKIIISHHKNFVVILPLSRI
jgi:hypothetical protein